MVEVASSRFAMGLMKMNKRIRNVIKKPHRMEKSVSRTDRHREVSSPIRKMATPIFVSKNIKSIIDLALTRPITSNAASMGDTPAGIIYLKTPIDLKDSFN